MENIKTISRPYATACFNYCLEQKNSNQELDFWQNVLNACSEIMKSKKSIDLLASNQKYQVKLTTFFKAVLPEEFKTKEVLNFLKVIEENCRYEALPDIANFYKELREDYDLPTIVKVISAKELTKAQKEKIGNKIAVKLNKKVKLQTSIDSSILSGFIIKNDDFILDCSGRKSLENIIVYLNK